MSQESTDEMRAEYDFSNAVQGKHHQAYVQGTNVVLLEPDVARVYRDSASVNKALRLLMEVARNQSTSNARPYYHPDRSGVRLAFGSVVTSQREMWVKQYSL